MKRIILSIALFAFGFTNAQETKFGAKLGMNISNITSEGLSTSSLVGGHLGGFAEVEISDKFKIQPELLFSMQGAKVEDSKTKLNYINLPVLAKYYVVDKLAVIAGPQVGFLMSAKETFESESLDAKDFYKTISLSFNIGASYDLTDNIFIDARYNLGLSNIAKEITDEEFDETITPKIKNNVIQFAVGYKF
jgi:opacity protein-like surface antigen